MELPLVVHREGTERLNLHFANNQTCFFLAAYLGNQPVCADEQRAEQRKTSAWNQQLLNHAEQQAFHWETTIMSCSVSVLITPFRSGAG